MLQHQRLASEQVDFENHLIGHRVNVIDINMKLATSKPLRKGLGVSDQSIFIVLEHRDIARHFLLGCGFINDDVLFLVKIALSL